MFTLRFKPEDFETGARTVSERFSAAMESSGQTRRTYFTNDPSTHSAVTLTFFHPDSSPDEWLNHPARHEILAILEPMFREPLETHQLEVEQVHDTR